MERKTKIFLLCLVSIVLIATAVVVSHQPHSYKKDQLIEIDRAVANAKALYRKRALEGWNFSSGPCLSNDLMRSWVVDVVHSPRTEVDDLPQNQCPAYLEGRAKHFVELDTGGNLVRVR